MRKLKKALSLSLALALSLAMAVPSFAAMVESTFVDVEGEPSRMEARLELDRDPLGVLLPWNANFDATTSDSIPLPNIYVPVGTKVRSFEIRTSPSESYSSGLFDEGEMVSYYGPDGTVESLNATNGDSFLLAREGEYGFGFTTFCGPGAALFAVAPGGTYHTTALAQPNGLEAKLNVYNITAQSTVSYQGKQIPLYNVLPGPSQDEANLWILLTAGASCVVNSYDAKIENGVLTAVEKENNWEFTGKDDYFWYGLDEEEVCLVEYIENGVTLQTVVLSTNNGSAPTQPEVKTANPSNDKLTVNGVEGTPTVYNIDNSNYFKIRDVAALLNGTEKQFSVGYDAGKQSVTATTGQGYDKLPTDLAGAPAGAGEAKASGDAIYVNGTKITPTVYNINGNNYFKLRDLGEALDFYIGWSLDRGVYIETDKPYAK